MFEAAPRWQDGRCLISGQRPGCTCDWGILKGENGSLSFQAEMGELLLYSTRPEEYESKCDTVFSDELWIMGEVGGAHCNMFILGHLPVPKSLLINDCQKTTQNIWLLNQFCQSQSSQNLGQSVSRDGCKRQILTEVSRWMGMDPGSIQAFLQLAIQAFPWPCPLPLIVTHSDRNLDQNSDQNSDLTLIKSD